MPKFIILSNGTHLGEVEAMSLDEALKSARKLWVNLPNIKAEQSDISDAAERANPISSIEMRKAVNAMVGKGKPLVGKTGGV